MGVATKNRLETLGRRAMIRTNRDLLEFSELAVDTLETMEKEKADRAEVAAVLRLFRVLGLYLDKDNNLAQAD